MSSYTMQLRELIEMWTQYDEIYRSPKEKIEIGRTKLFDFDYPIFDSEYKKTFETHFIRNFYMREIGFETEGLFKFQLETWLLIHMPYFNKLFESELLTFNPLYNSEMNVTKNKTADKTQNDTRNSTTTASTDGTSSGTNEQDATGSLVDDNFSRNLESDNPDSRLALTANDGEGVIQYASSIKENTDNNSKTSTSNTTATDTTTSSVDSTGTVNDTTTSTINDTEDYIEHVIGKTGTQSYAKLLQEYRESFIRIEKQIFNEMQELFMLVY